MSAIKNILVSGVILGASALAPSAGAVDDKIIPGTSCQVAFGTGTYIVDGSVQNFSTTSGLDLDCPLVRENIGTATPVINNATVWVINPGPANTSVVCSLYTESFNTGAFMGQTQTSSSINANPQPLNFGAVNGAANWAVHFRCSLPASLAPVGASALKNIRWQEP
jgi:hypothetical protein